MLSCVEEKLVTCLRLYSRLREENERTATFATGALPCETNDAEQKL